MFGQDFENFEAHEEDADDKPAVETSNPSAPRVDKAKKGKLAAKSTGHTYQFQIMESIDVPRSEIKKFADPYYWSTYFPPIAIVSPGLFSPSSTLITCILRRTTVPWGHA
jgi:leucyl-tRNA synthetase